LIADPEIFVLDANVFIEAFRRYYAFDIAPSFWDFLVEFADAGIIRSIDRVKTQDLDPGKDKLAAWAGTKFAHGFASTNESDIIEYYGRVITWVQGEPQFKEAAKYEFANEPDGWLIAYAGAKKCILVTHEVLAREVKNKVPIPNVCEVFSITHIDTFEMLRKLGFHFS
jgi:hypothetical protein